jgi:hypothetical protein
MWSLQAIREGSSPIAERYRRQGTAYRRARQLYAAGYEITAVQYSIEEPPEPLAVYRFDGIRFVRIPRAPNAG